MPNRIELHYFNDTMAVQAGTWLKVGGQLIPPGYINLTHITEQTNYSMHSFLRRADTQELFDNWKLSQEDKEFIFRDEPDASKSSNAIEAQAVPVYEPYNLSDYLRDNPAVVKARAAELDKNCVDQFEDYEFDPQVWKESKPNLAPIRAKIDQINNIRHQIFEARNNPGYTLEDRWANQTADGMGFTVKDIQRDIQESWDKGELIGRAEICLKAFWSKAEKLKTEKEKTDKKLAKTQPTLPHSSQVQPKYVVSSNKSTPLEERGTWVHRDVFYAYAQLVSVEFRLWALQTLGLFLSGQELTEERREEGQVLAMSAATGLTVKEIQDAIRIQLNDSLSGQENELAEVQSTLKALNQSTRSSDMELEQLRNHVVDVTTEFREFRQEAEAKLDYIIGLLVPKD
jgi:KilA-N domain